MKITGQQIADGVNAWVADELKSGPSREYDLGKFLFTVGSGTIGVLIVSAKLDRAAGNWNAAMIASFALLLISIAISMYMVQPKKWEIEDTTDLFDKRASIIKRTVIEARLWFGTWVVGLILGVLGVFTQW